MRDSYVNLKAVVKSLGAAGIMALGAVSMAASAQTVAQPTPDNPLGLPETINIIGNDNPNERTATAIVNGFVITGTDVDQRVALVTSASDAKVSDEELQRLRVQVHPGFSEFMFAGNETCKSP